MIKKAPLNQLARGMFVHDLNCGWLGHPFVTSRFLIKDDATLDKVRKLDIEYVLIDTERGADLSADAPAPSEVQKAAPASSVKIKVATPAAKPKPATAPLVEPPPPELPALEEMERARELHTATMAMARSLFDDTRRGKPLEADKLEPLIEQLIGSLRRNKHALISLGRLRQIDHYTYEHSVSTAVLLTAFGRDIGLEDQVLHGLALGGLLHDIGKSRIDPAILNKPFKLDEREKAIMRGHVQLGERLVEQIPNVSPVTLEVVAQHHERLDGSGYPRKLSGGQIGLHGRMAAIVDSYDALATDRSYSAGVAPTEALRRLLEWPKGKLSPTLVQRFIQCVGIYPVGSLVRLASDRLAVVIDETPSALLRPKVRVVYDVSKDTRLPEIDLDLNEIDRAEDWIINFEPHGAWGIAPFTYLTA